MGEAERRRAFGHGEKKPCAGAVLVRRIMNDRIEEQSAVVVCDPDVLGEH